NCRRRRSARSIAAQASAHIIASSWRFGMIDSAPQHCPGPPVPRRSAGANFGLPAHMVAEMRGKEASTRLPAGLALDRAVMAQPECGAKQRDAEQQRIDR